MHHNNQINTIAFIVQYNAIKNNKMKIQNIDFPDKWVIENDGASMEKIVIFGGLDTIGIINGKLHITFKVSGIDGNDFDLEINTLVHDTVNSYFDQSHLTKDETKDIYSLAYTLIGDYVDSDIIINEN